MCCTISEACWHDAARRYCSRQLVLKSSIGNIELYGRTCGVLVLKVGFDGHIELRLSGGCVCIEQRVKHLEMLFHHYVLSIGIELEQNSKLKKAP